MALKNTAREIPLRTIIVTKRKRIFIMAMELNPKHLLNLGIVITLTSWHLLLTIGSVWSYTTE